MIVHVRFSAIKGIRPHEWAVRFVFGGSVCVIAGLIAEKYGPTVGGLFLAFPAIFPAGASLIEAHEKMHKQRIGANGTVRGRLLAALDALGATLGCAGLVAFAVVFWLWLPRSPELLVFCLATLAWLTAAVGAWLLWRRIHRLRRMRRAVR
jgi:Protein of unknown function (DUF3147)